MSLACSAQSTKAGVRSDSVYSYVEQMPKPGYDITGYVNKHLKYPDSAADNNIQGRVIVKFVVNEDGSISNCKVEKGIGGGCDEEALKVLKSMPKWDAGIHNGHEVKVLTMLPVTFTLTGTGQIYEYVDQMPRPSYDLLKFIKGYAAYLDSIGNNKIRAAAIIRFVVNEDGKISGPKVIKSTGSSLDSEALNVVMNMPPFRAGKKNGKPVKVYFTANVGVGPVEKKEGSDAPASKDADRDQKPEPTFNMSSYLQKNMRYPSDARENNIQGKVVVGFVVDEEGRVNNCSILKGIGGGCDEEALRIVKEMPNWKPGKIEGKPVKVYFTLPIQFKLN